MQPYLNRTEAKIKGVDQYFTGLPCKHGHVTYRYTNSGACSSCVKLANGRSPESDARRVARSQFVRINLRAYDNDRGALAAAVWAFAIARSPVLLQSDVDPHLLPAGRSGGTSLYAFYCDAADASALRDLSSQMLTEHSRGQIDVARPVNDLLCRIHGDTIAAQMALMPDLPKPTIIYDEPG